jgi:hypothetical protein
MAWGFDESVEMTQQLGAELLVAVRAGGTTVLASRIDAETTLGTAPAITHVAGSARLALLRSGMRRSDQVREESASITFSRS